MLTKVKKHLTLMAFGWSLGAGLRDKLTLLGLLSYHIGVNRGLWTFPGTVHRLDIAFSGQQRSIHLRNNGVDILILADLFQNGWYSASGPYTPRVIVDAGANIGLAAVYLSMKYPNAVIHSFEPVEFVLCRQNAKQVHTDALGRQSGEVDILIDPCNSGGHRLALYDSQQGLARQRVAVRRLDELIDEKVLPPPDFLKIDAEGAECDILEGLGNHAHTLHAVVAETQNQANHLWLKERLQALGFEHITETIVNPDASKPSDAYAMLAARRQD